MKQASNLEQPDQIKLPIDGDVHTATLTSPQKINFSGQTVRLGKQMHDVFIIKTMQNALNNNHGKNIIFNFSQPDNGRTIF